MGIVRRFQPHRPRRADAPTRRVDHGPLGNLHRKGAALFVGIGHGGAALGNGHAAVGVGRNGAAPAGLHGQVVVGARLGRPAPAGSRLQGRWASSRWRWSRRAAPSNRPAPPSPCRQASPRCRLRAASMNRRRWRRLPCSDAGRDRRPCRLHRHCRAGGWSRQG